MEVISPVIIIRFKNICKTYRLTIQTIHNKTGISRNTLTSLKYNKSERINLDVLDRLCIFFNNYFQCTINDIIEFVDENKV